MIRLQRLTAVVAILLAVGVWGAPSAGCLYEDRVCGIQLKALYDEAVHLYSTESWTAAIDLFERVVGRLELSRGAGISNVEEFKLLYVESFNYLQFSYYSAGNVEAALDCATQYLSFDPSDETMISNVEYYIGVAAQKDVAADDLGSFRNRPAFADVLDVPMDRLGYDGATSEQPAYAVLPAYATFIDERLALQSRVLAFLVRAIDKCDVEFANAGERRQLSHIVSAIQSSRTLDVDDDLDGAISCCRGRSCNVALAADLEAVWTASVLRGAREPELSSALVFPLGHLLGDKFREMTIADVVSHAVEASIASTGPGEGLHGVLQFLESTTFTATRCACLKYAAKRVSWLNEFSAERITRTHAVQWLTGNERCTDAASGTWRFSEREAEAFAYTLPEDVDSVLDWEPLALDEEDYAEADDDVPQAGYVFYEGYKRNALFYALGSLESSLDWWKLIPRKLMWDILTQPLETFKTWRIVRFIPLLSPNVHDIETLALDVAFRGPRHDRWRRALEETLSIGNPRKEFLRVFPKKWESGDPAYDVSTAFFSSANLIHLAYHVHMFDTVIGSDLAAFDHIVEIGGGYGGMMSIAYDLGFRGSYAIFDLAPLQLLQEYNARRAGVPVLDRQACTERDVPFRPGYCACESVDDVGAVLSSRDGKTLLIATWSFSELPLDLRSDLLPAIAGVDAVLLSYQHEMFGIDNIEYFAKFGPFQSALNSQPTAMHWETVPIPYMPFSGGNTYLFGTR